MSWRVPERGKGESLVRYRDKLNGLIDKFRTYDNDRFSPSVRGRFRDHIRLLEKALRRSWEPGVGSH